MTLNILLCLIFSYVMPSIYYWVEYVFSLFLKLWTNLVSHH